MITDIYPFLENITISQKVLRDLSTLFDNRDMIIEEYSDNLSIKTWMDSGRIETIEDLFYNEHLLLSVVEREFSKNHPLYKNTKKIIRMFEELV
jgi:hypothetical protein